MTYVEDEKAIKIMDGIRELRKTLISRYWKSTNHEVTKDTKRFFIKVNKKMFL